MFGHHDHDDKPVPNFGTLGSKAFFQYWSNLANVSMSLLETQTFGWVAFWQAAATGTLDKHEFARLAANLWRTSFSTFTGLMAFPFEWSIRRLMSTPSLVFLVDGCSQTVGPVSAATAITVPQGMLVMSTDLQMINGTAVIPASQVQVLMASRGNRVDVTLVNLANSSASTTGNTLANGFYVGVVYAWEAPNRRPLALVYVNVNNPKKPVLANTVPPI